MLTFSGAVSPPSLRIIDDIVRKTRNVETGAIVRKKFVGCIGDDLHVSAAFKLFLRNVINDNNRLVVRHYSNCHRGYTALQHAKDGRCNTCW